MLRGRLSWLAVLVTAIVLVGACSSTGGSAAQTMGLTLRQTAKPATRR